MEMLARMWKEESGQGMAEYALILVLVALVCITGFQFLGDKIDSRVKNVGNSLM